MFVTDREGLKYKQGEKLVILRILKIVKFMVCLNFLNIVSFSKHLS